MSKGTVNKVIIVGRMGKDPEMQLLPTGTSIAKFSVATNHSQKDSSGNWVEQTEWHNVVCFGKQADFAGDYLKKGQLVYLEGRIQTRSWDDQEGKKHYRTEIIINNLTSLGSKQEGPAPADSDHEETAENPPRQVKDAPADNGATSDDLPF
jgi:single-strand DNA-binding protein